MATVFTTNIPLDAYEAVNYWKHCGK